MSALALSAAFHDRAAAMVIDSVEHPVRRLRGAFHFRTFFLGT